MRERVETMSTLGEKGAEGADKQELGQQQTRRRADKQTETRASTETSADKPM